MTLRPPRSSGIGGLSDGTVELDVVLAVVADVVTEIDVNGDRRASLVLEGHLPATQLSEDGVTIVPLEALHLSGLAVTRDVAERLVRWGSEAAEVTGRVHFDRRAVDPYRGRGPLRALALVDARGNEIVLQAD